MWAAIALAVSLSIIGCSGNGTDSGSTSSIDSKIDLQISEKLDSIQRSLIIHAQTERIYGCSNYTLSGNAAKSGSTIALTFQNVVSPSQCSAANAPAAAQISLGLLAKGNYAFTITVNGVAAVSNLIVTDTSYSILNGAGEWISFTNTGFFKVPDGIVWGIAKYNATGAGGLYRAFSDSLAAWGAVNAVYPAGDYNYFQIDSSGAVVLPYGNNNFHAAFMYHYAGDLLKIRSMLKSYGLLPGSPIVIDFYTSEGIVYESNLLPWQP